MCTENNIEISAYFILKNQVVQRSRKIIGLWEKILLLQNCVKLTQLEHLFPSSYEKWNLKNYIFEIKYNGKDNFNKIIPKSRKN